MGEMNCPTSLRSRRGNLLPHFIISGKKEIFLSPHGHPLALNMSSRIRLEPIFFKLFLCSVYIYTYCYFLLGWCWVSATQKQTFSKDKVTMMTPKFLSNVRTLERNSGKSLEVFWGYNFLINFAQFISLVASEFIRKKKNPRSLKNPARISTVLCENFVFAQLRLCRLRKSEQKNKIFIFP